LFEIVQVITTPYGAIGNKIIWWKHDGTIWNTLGTSNSEKIPPIPPTGPPREKELCLFEF
jgi:hypothetical protein